MSTSNWVLLLKPTRLPYRHLNLVQAANAHNHMQLTVDELRFVVDYPYQVHKVLTVNIPDPTELNGIKRDEDMLPCPVDLRQLMTESEDVYLMSESTRKATAQAGLLSIDANKQTG